MRYIITAWCYMIHTFYRQCVPDSRCDRGGGRISEKQGFLSILGSDSIQCTELFAFELPEIRGSEPCNFLELVG